MNTEAALIRQMTASEATDKKVDMLVKAVTDLTLTVETLRTEIAALKQVAPVATLDATDPTDYEVTPESPNTAVYKRKSR